MPRELLAACCFFLLGRSVTKKSGPRKPMRAKEKERKRRKILPRNRGRLGPTMTTKQLPSTTRLLLLLLLPSSQPLFFSSPPFWKKEKKASLASNKQKSSMRKKTALWRARKAKLTRLSLLVIGRNSEMAANQTFSLEAILYPWRTLLQKRGKGGLRSLLL